MLSWLHSKESGMTPCRSDSVSSAPPSPDSKPNYGEDVDAAKFSDEDRLLLENLSTYFKV